MTKATNVYGPVFKGWQAKQLGPKPTDELLSTAHSFGRVGKQSLALAMAMRDCGVSGAQITMACGAPQNNHRRGLIAGGLFKREAVPANEQGHTVYKIKLTAKGEAAMKRKAEAEAKAALDGGDKPAKVTKAKRVKKVKAETPAPAEALEPQAPVTEAPAAQPQA